MAWSFFKNEINFPPLSIQNLVFVFRSLQQHADYDAALKFVVNLGSDRLRLSPARNSLAVFFLCVGTSQQVANSYLPRPAGLMLSVSGFLNPSSQPASGDETLFCHSPLSCSGGNVSGAWREGRCLSQFLIDCWKDCITREKKKTLSLER